jgi:hypothetical protein
MRGFPPRNSAFKDLLQHAWKPDVLLPFAGKSASPCVIGALPL